MTQSVRLHFEAYEWFSIQEPLSVAYGDGGADAEAIAGVLDQDACEVATAVLMRQPFDLAVTGRPEMFGALFDAVERNAERMPTGQAAIYALTAGVPLHLLPDKARAWVRRERPRVMADLAIASS